jgi:hypothetical protein
MFVVCGTQHWRGELPPGWCAQHGPAAVAFYHPDGVGALQLSSFRKPDGDVTDADLRVMAVSAPGCDELRPARAGEFAGLYCESERDGTYWGRWFVSRGRVALHITYNCAAEERDREQEEVERVVTSLRCPLNPAPQ